ncbi:MAG: aminoacyl-tRNA hydrolase [Clostridia bacterium]|nr:aminoacyl-tRNA hydrolase [Candidatus Pelethousia sp.]NCB30605.1 aminoacyl-tRNA hydrolase [Clostridia bacterium]
MFIIVGLGNPGREYANTRHNVGFLTLDILARRWGIDIKRHNFQAVFGEGFVDGQKIVLVKPETYMNESGRAVRDVLNWYKCEHQELLLIYDDIDIPLGDIRIRSGGSAGTHNGMRSVIYQLCFDDFPRIRVGIGQAAGQRSLVSHVLSMPQGEDLVLLESAMEKAADAAGMITKGRLLDAQAQYNKRPPKEKLKNGGEAEEIETGPKDRGGLGLPKIL